jgi:hypothetical protein
MTIATRGVSKHWIARDRHIEKVCDCACHEHSGVFHFVPCCHDPKTTVGKFSLEAFNMRGREMDINEMLNQLEADMKSLSEEERNSPIMTDEHGVAWSPNEWLESLRKDAAKSKEEVSK